MENSKKDGTLFIKLVVATVVFLFLAAILAEMVGILVGAVK